MGKGVLTSGFHRAGVGDASPEGSAGAGVLNCEGVPLDRIAQAVGTPAYVYSSATVRDRYEQLDAMLATVPHRVHYTLKANSNQALLRLLRSLGAGADVVSGGELARALRAGFTPADVIFGGVGKTEDELRAAVEAGVLLVNVESEAEVRCLDRVAGELGRRAPVSIRANPELTVEAAHAYIKTGERGHKFGVPYDDVLHVARIAASAAHVDLLGLDMHLGSQLSRIDPYREGVERLAALHATLVREGIDTLRYLDVGGGLGVRYDTEQPPDLDRFASLVLPAVRATGLRLIMEPGRFVVGNAGVLLTRVLYLKRSGGKNYLVCDAGMTELLRPSHYGAFHAVSPVSRRGEAGAHERMVADVVGPVCESGDFLALDRTLEDVGPGDLLAICDVGAYGYAMASNYNSRFRPPEVLVDGDAFAVVTRRETIEDLTQLEINAPDWRH
jgi:diaminopimelate decarboxylase